MRGGRLLQAIDLLPNSASHTCGTLASKTLPLLSQEQPLASDFSLVRNVPRCFCNGVNIGHSLKFPQAAIFATLGSGSSLCPGQSALALRPLGVSTPGLSSRFSGRYTKTENGSGFSSARICCTAVTASSSGEMASVKAETPQVVFVHNDQLIETAQTAAEFLGSSPRGAYTTARTVNRHSVFEFEFHVARLAQSVELMMAADVQSGASGETDLHPEITKADSLRPIVVKALQVGMGAFSQRYPDQSGELKVTALLTWTSKRYDLDVHLTPLPAPPKPPVKVEARGHPRTNAAAKDSEWVRQRKVLEDSKPADVNEILLMGEEGGVLEGMSSNFFVVRHGAVETAQAGVLLGTVREVALAACRRQGVAVELRAPNVNEADSWEGAFISSTSRLVLPIDELLIPGPQGGRVLKFEQPLVHNIAQWVRDDVAANSTRIL